MPKKNMITEDMVGCWLDGSQGWHNTYRVLDIARSWGWRPAYPWDVRQAVKLYATGDTDATIKHNKGRDTMTYDEASEWITGQGGLCDQATEYLQGRCPDGFSLLWDAGELSLVSDIELDAFEDYD